MPGTDTHKTVCDIKQHTGVPTMLVNGTPRFSMAYCSYYPTQSRYKQMADHGVHFYSIHLTCAAERKAIPYVDGESGQRDDKNDAVFANESYLAVSASANGKQIIRLPKKAGLREVIPLPKGQLFPGEGESFLPNTEFEIEFQANTCRIFQLVLYP